MKVDENGWKWMNVDESGWTYLRCYVLRVVLMLFIMMSSRYLHLFYIILLHISYPVISSTTGTYSSYGLRWFHLSFQTNHISWLELKCFSLVYHSSYVNQDWKQHDVYSSRNLSWFGWVCGELHSRTYGHVMRSWWKKLFGPSQASHIMWHGPSLSPLPFPFALDKWKNSVKSCTHLEQTCW